MSILLKQPACNQCGQQLNLDDLTCSTHGSAIRLENSAEDKTILLPIWCGDHQAILTMMVLFDHLAKKTKVDLANGFRGPVIGIYKMSPKEAAQIAVLSTHGNDLIVNLPRNAGIVVSMSMGTNFVPIYHVTIVGQNGKTTWINVGVHKLYQNSALRAALNAAISS